MGLWPPISWRVGVLLDVLQPGSLFGEMSLLDHEKRTAYVIAETDMRLLVMSRREFRSPRFLVCPVVERCSTRSVGDCGGLIMSGLRARPVIWLRLEQPVDHTRRFRGF